MQFIDLQRSYERYQTEIDARMATVLRHGRYIMGPEVAELEQALADFVGVSHCITVSSGTASLEIALRALEVGPGDEVITVPFTWISSAEVIRLVGATPVFVDIDPDTYNLDPRKLQQACTEKTKAILPVSLFGQMPDLHSINTIASHYGATVIEDAAQSFGATQYGYRSCSRTSIASTSFFPAKPLGCFGDGGALFTNNDGLAESMRAIRTHGGTKRHHHTLVGTNGRMDTLQAAVLLAKLPHFQREVTARMQLGQRYSDQLGSVCHVPKVSDGNTHVYGQYTLRTGDRDRLQDSLKKLGIPTGVYYPKCLHEQPVFQDLGYRHGDFPIAELASREVISLPMHPFLTEIEQNRVIKSVLTVANRRSCRAA